MQVEDFLAAVPITVDDQPITVLRDALFRGDPLGHQHHPADQFRLLGLADQEELPEADERLFTASPGFLSRRCC